MNDDSELFVGDSDVLLGDSGVFRNSEGNAGLFEVYEAGKLTVVGFAGRDVPSDFWLGRYNRDLEQIIELHECEELAIDLTGVKFIPSGLLGLMSSLRRKGVRVSLYNPSEDVRDVLKTTHLESVIPTREVDFS